MARLFHCARVVAVVLTALLCAAGAAFGADGATAAGTVPGALHWAFQPLREPKPGIAGNAATGTSNPIDSFLAPAGRGEAPRPQLVRRLAFDLTGLPPTPEEVSSFANDSAPDAYERLVIRLLASRHYGERWGRHWLDVARYADSNGYEGDEDRPLAWPYRDWVIRAWNSDLPFDTFVQWQLAGDEFAPDNPDAVVATGFLAAGPSQATTPADTEENKLKIRYDELDDILSTVGNGFLGLTLGCARCHDHKFDPIPTRDYYRMLSAFSTSQRIEGALLKPRREFDLWKAEQHQLRREVRMTELGLTDDEKFWLRQPEHFFVPIQIELYKKHGAALKSTDEQLRASLGPEAKAVWDAFEAAIARATARPPGTPERALVVVDRQSAPMPEFLLHRGSVLGRSESVSLGFLQVLSRGREAAGYWREARRDGGATAGTGAQVGERGFLQLPTTFQRRALADWITDPVHGAGQLLARVIVNRLWQHHFGEGLVRTPNDFGTQGEAPSHLELLDWLAGELIRGGWRLKPIQRLILSSAAYRQAVAGGAATPASGFARRPVRLEGEVLRDALLAVSGRLNRKMFGPPFRPPIPKEAMATRSKDAYPSDLKEGVEVWRRSVYAFAKHSVRHPMLEVFDAPDPNSSCGRRNRTTVPTQALTLLNDDFVRQCAVQFAQRVITEAGLEPAAQVQRAYLLALGRAPTASESRTALRFVEGASDRVDDAVPVEGLTDLCHALFTLNEFLYVD